jgi:DNA (cytosine-5)-methyltransferase 1
LKGKRKIYAADLFCGAGGTSQGLLMAANRINADLELLAINHWQVAIDSHSLNHPEAKSLCTGVDVVDPLKLVPGGRLDVLCASPECTHHSVARGGRPKNDQSRASAWCVLRWAQVLYIDNIVIENVPEFQSWGPLGANGRPMKSKKGALFQQFIESLKALGYRVEYRVLNCADYGDPTTRRRLFVIARRGNKTISWPEPTHVPASQLVTTGLFKETRKQWRSAREIIDWSIPSKSIFERKRPLADKTLLRIQAGLKKFCGLDVDLRKCFAEEREGQSPRTHSVDAPMPTVATSVPGLIEPFMVTVNHGEGDTTRKARSIDQPMPTTTSKIGEGICEPFLIAYYGTQNMSETGEPLPTVTSHDRFGLVEAEVTHYRLDIRFRMLQPRELARAQGFPDSYEFTGNREAVVKQIGNAVPPNTAMALISEVLA